MSSIPPNVPDAAVRAPRVMLLGGPMTGKTHSLRTLVTLDIDVRIIATEYPDVLADVPCVNDKGVGIHWKYIEPGKADWATLLDNAAQINSLSNDMLQKLAGINKQKYKQFFDVLNACKEFKCDRCGKNFGDASTWSTNVALAMDSLSGLSIMARDLAVGAKPIITQPDWGVMMQNLEAFLNVCVTGTKCWFILTAHLEKEMDEAAGTTKLMASTLGRKLAPKLPRYFSDVILCKRNGVSFQWDVNAPDTDVKARNLPFGRGDLNQNFQQIHDAWKKRTGL